MLLVDTRRLTGPSHLSRAPLVLVDVALAPGDDVEGLVSAYRRELDRMRAAIGDPPAPAFVLRSYQGGLFVAYEAPIDVMLAHAEVSEWAALSAIEIASSRAALPLEPKRFEIASMKEAQVSPRMLTLASEARRRGVPFLWDDDEVSVGAGKGALTFARSAVPSIEDVEWSRVGSIPIALVTGTNGKTTSSRLLAHVAREAGFVVANTSTDGVVVGGEVVETGDWTGPAAARMALRREGVELAVLETARGGILRRGLAIDACDVALVTNVSDDHLGTYGVDDLAAMTEVKGVVALAARSGGVAVLNAHDENLLGLASRLSARVVLFADLDARRAPAEAAIAEHRARGGEVVVAEGGDLVVAEGERAWSLGRVDELPITFGGAARFNVENVLGVVAAARGLGVEDAAIAAALRSFAVTDNPHRGQLHDVGGVRVLLDFGHNPEAVRAVLRLVAALRERTPGRLFVVTGSPGDRSDREIEDIARAIGEHEPTRVLVRELGDYLRGRAPGAVPALFLRAFEASGLAADACRVVDSEVEALTLALADARPGDVVAVLVHIERDAVAQLLASLSNESSIANHR